MHNHQPRHLNGAYSIFDEALLGKGSTGNVYLGCVNGNPAQKVAIKSINLLQINNQVTRYLLSCEIAALSNLGKLQNTQHDNVVRLLQIIILQNYIYLVMELLQGGTLADYIRNNPNGIPEQEVMVILRQILEGYKRIKDKHIVHRDLKPDNILFKATLNQSKRLAIIDFGYCEMRQVPNKPKIFYNVGSPKYMSPQAYKQNKYSQKSDIWAIGVMLYEMLLGKTCDQGMNMQAYLQMLQTKGVPLPSKLKDIHKHILTLMLAYSDQARIQCDSILKILDLHQNFEQIAQRNLYPNNQDSRYLRATVEISPSQKPNRNNPIFHSALLPSQTRPNLYAMQQQPMQIICLPRSQSRFSQQNQNRMQEIRAFVPDFGKSFQNQQRPLNRMLVQQKLQKVVNLQVNQAKQIFHRRQLGQPINSIAQFKTSNTSPFSKPNFHFFEHSNNPAQNQGPPMMHIQRTAMNQLVNQENMRINLPYQVKSSNTIPNPELTYSKIVHQNNQGPQIFAANNQNTMIHSFQIARGREIENFSQPFRLKKQASEEVRFVGTHNFTQQNRRQSQNFIKPIPQNRINLIPINQLQISNDLTLTRHPFPDLTRTLRPQQDLTLTRVPHYDHHQVAIQRADLTQTRFPVQLVNNDLTISKAPRDSREVDLFLKQGPPQHSQTSQGFNHRNQLVLERLQATKPVPLMREIINLKPQVTVRNNGHKINYVRLTSNTQITRPVQQPHLMLLRQKIVK